MAEYTEGQVKTLLAEAFARAIATQAIENSDYAERRRAGGFPALIGQKWESEIETAKGAFALTNRAWAGGQNFRVYVAAKKSKQDLGYYDVAKQSFAWNANVTWSDATKSKVEVATETALQQKVQSADEWAEELKQRDAEGKDEN